MYQVIYGTYDKSDYKTYGKPVEGKIEAENIATNLYNEERQYIDWTDIKEVIK